MKRTLLLLILPFMAMIAAAQEVTISGKLANCSEKTLELVVNNETGSTSYKIDVRPDGSFNYKTGEIKTPCQANITNRKHIQIQLFLAPGYDLGISADAKDYPTIRNTIAYSGIGAATNNYWTKLSGNTPDTTKWVKKDEATYVKHLTETPKFAAAHDAVFNEQNTDPYKDYFSQAIKIDAQISPLLSLFASYAYEHNYSWQQIEKVIHQLGMDGYMNILNDEKNLKSNAFRYFIEEYPFYCDNYTAFPADSLRKKEGNYSLYLADKLFSGKIYDYVALQILTRSLSSTYKFDDFKKLTPYIHKMGAESEAVIEKMLKARSLEAVSLQAGTPSPVFSLPDTSGNLHQIDKFRGKVIYIDLWASWCGPCREENPFLKKIYSAYKDNNQVAIISIAAFDAKNRPQRYEIIKKEKMDWLQLEDTEDSFAKSYQASFIPRFIIIDKKGNIVDSDAPRPSDGNKLTAILNREINK